MTPQPKRNRPRISTTIGARTQAIIHMVAKEQALQTPGASLDYIVNDWARLKQAALNQAHPDALLRLAAA